MPLLRAPGGPTRDAAADFFLVISLIFYSITDRDCVAHRPSTACLFFDIVTGRSSSTPVSPGLACGARRCTTRSAARPLCDTVSKPIVPDFSAMFLICAASSSVVSCVHPRSDQPISIHARIWDRCSQYACIFPEHGGLPLCRLFEQQRFHTWSPPSLHLHRRRPRPRPHRRLVAARFAHGLRQAVRVLRRLLRAPPLRHPDHSALC